MKTKYIIVDCDGYYCNEHASYYDELGRSLCHECRTNIIIHVLIVSDSYMKTVLITIEDGERFVKIVMKIVISHAKIVETL